MFYYAEIKDGEIVSYGESTSMDLAFEKTIGIVMEITEKQHALLAACHGDLVLGMARMKTLRDKIDDYVTQLHLDTDK